jgi:hypothetical protein
MPFVHGKEQRNGAQGEYETQMYAKMREGIENWMPTTEKAGNQRRGHGKHGERQQEGEERRLRILPSACLCKTNAAH